MNSAKEADLRKRWTELIIKECREMVY